MKYNAPPAVLAAVHSMERFSEKNVSPPMVLAAVHSKKIK